MGGEDGSWVVGGWEWAVEGQMRIESVRECLVSVCVCACVCVCVCVCGD